MFQAMDMDIISLLQKDPDIWDLFTSKEEYSNPLRDQYDRFPYYASSNRDLFDPKASRYLFERGYRIEYPDDTHFAVCLTHDIDIVYRSIPSKGLAALHSLKQCNPSSAFRTLSQACSRKIPLCNFQDIMELEEKYGAKSTFFFMAEHSDEQDYSYNIEDLEQEIGKIVDRGWEIGLHGGCSSYLSQEEMREKKKRLEKVGGKSVNGYRNHYLRFRTPDTWQFLSDAGFQYDTTFGYADCVGFRNGMCHPFKPFNRITRSEIDILEIPLTIMDCTLESYMRLDAGNAWEITHRLIDATKRCHGVITILWHNTYMEGEWLKFYEKIMRYCKEKGAWMVSGEEILVAARG